MSKKIAFDPIIVKDFYKEHLNIDLIEEFMFHSERKWRFDFCIPKLMIAIEIEGGIWGYGGHSRGKGFVEDMEKYNEATAMGWRILRTRPSQCCMMEMIDLLKRTIKIVKDTKVYKK